MVDICNVMPKGSTQIKSTFVVGICYGVPEGSSQVKIPFVVGISNVMLQKLAPNMNQSPAL